MSKRSFALALLFVLGCGGSLLAGLALASGFDEGFLDENLYYTDDGAKIVLTHTGTEDGYLFVVDGQVAGPLYDPRESQIIAREGLKTLRVFRVTPVVTWDQMGFRPCTPDFHDCPLPRKPLPPPPPPIMSEGDYEFVRGEHVFVEPRF